VTFNGSSSTPAPGGTIVTYEWDLDGDGVYERSGSASTQNWFYFTIGTFTVRLRVTDDRGLTDVATVGLTIMPFGSSAPRSLSASAARRPTATGSAFTARLAARPVSGRPGRLERRGPVQSLRGTIVTGRFDGRLARSGRASAAEALLAKLLRADFRARLDASVNVRTRTSTTTMLALATFPQRSHRASPALACVRITITERPGRTPAGTFRVLGGTGAARALAATGTFAFRPGRHTPSTLAGRVRAQLAGARSLPPACTALRSR
jgi:hypothetical protein